MSETMTSIETGAVTMQRITRSEYNAIHPDFRGRWTTERYDWPNWSEDRERYIGKRTMMAADGSCSLLIEGIHFEIVPDGLSTITTTKEQDR